MEVIIVLRCGGMYNSNNCEA